MSIKIRIGNDLVQVSRFEKSLGKSKFIEKIFHPIEIEYCEKKIQKSPSYAARFAAKEAFSKALGSGLYAQGVTPQDMWIENLESGKPQLFFSENLQIKLNELGVYDWDVTLSHHGDYAIAHVTLLLTKPLA